MTKLPFAKMGFPEMYEEALVRPLFQPWAALLLDDVGLTDGDRVLDVACGTGIVARLAKERLGAAGKVVGIDLNPQMIGVARRITGRIDWREGDATALPLRDKEQFDVVVCQQGLQFIRDKPAAVRQMRVALDTGGRLAVSTWCSDEDSPVLRELRRIAERHTGPISDTRHSFGEAGPLEALLRDAGFHHIQSKTLSRTIRFEDGSVFVRLNAMALVGMSTASTAMSAEEREQVVAAIASDSAALVRAHTDASGFAYEIAATVATARA